MPTPLLAAAVTAALLAVCCAALTPLLLSWLPAPQEAPQVRFDALGTRRFRLLVLGFTAAMGWLCLALIDPSLWPVWLPLIGLGTLLGLIDAETTFLPFRLSYLTLALVSLGALTSAGLRSDPWSLLWAAAGCAAAAGLFWLLWRFSGEKFGFGDVRLAAVLGVVGGATSPAVLYWMFLLGTLIGAIWAIVVRLQGRRQFAYGPALLLGAPAALLLNTVLT